MATNKGFSAFDEIEPIKDIMKDADLITSSNVNKGGRKPKDIKANSVVRVYMVEEQKKAFADYCLENGTTESTFIKGLLLKEGIIKAYKGT